MPVLNDNPFAVLTAVVAPAVLTNACSVLALGTSNRVARVVDRTRVVVHMLGAAEPASDVFRFHLGQLEKLRIRSRLLLLALRLFYGALGGFASSAIISILGAAMAYYSRQTAFRVTAVAAVVIGVLAVGALVAGCGLMVGETRFALTSIREEAEEALGRFRTAGTLS